MEIHIFYGSIMYCSALYINTVEHHSKRQFSSEEVQLHFFSLPPSPSSLKRPQKDYSLASLSLPPHHEGLALRVNAQSEVKVHGGQYPVEEVHDPYQTGLVEGGVDWGQVDVEIGPRN